MTERTELENTQVGDARNLLVENATVIAPDVSIEQFLAKTIEDPQTRHVDVLDEEGVLVGAVRMNTVVEYLFPFSALVASGGPAIARIPSLGARTVRDIMNTKPHYIEESTPLSDMAKILMQEKINELPVVDEDRRVIGQGNVYEVIAAYLNEINGQ